MCSEQGVANIRMNLYSETGKFEMSLVEKDPSDPILNYSNHSAGIFSFVDARGKDKRSSMHGSQLRAGPRAFSRSGKRGTAHHRGLVSLRISDGKFVNHTTEMIL